jgi:hypothetical protein
MVDFGKGLRTKKYVYKDDTGVEQVLIIKPLTTDFIPLLFSVAKRLPKTETENLLDVLTSEVIEDILKLCDATLKASYPSLDDSLRQEFVSCHYLKLLPVIVEVNLDI